MSNEDTLTLCTEEAVQVASDLIARLGASLLDAGDLLSVDLERKCATRTDAGKRCVKAIHERWVQHLKVVHRFAVRELTAMLITPQLNEEKHRLQTQMTNCARHMSEAHAHVEAYRLQIDANSAKLAAADTQPWLLDSGQLAHAEQEALNVTSMARLATERAVSFADSCIPSMPAEEPPTDPVEAAVRAALSVPKDSEAPTQYGAPDEAAAFRTFLSP